MTSGNLSLGDLGGNILELFSVITSAAIKSPQKLGPGVTVSDTEVEAQRFRLWATNLNLFHDAHGSLEYRLRDAPGILELARFLLQELSESLEHRMQAFFAIRHG